MIKILPFNIDSISLSVEVIRDGGIIVYPTDTVYGIGGYPFKEDVVNRVAMLKGRADKPFPILVDDINTVMKLVEVKSPSLRKLLNKIWPGPITVVLPAKTSLSPLLGGDYIGLRIPNEPLLRKMIKEAGGSLIGTSANISGKPPAQDIHRAISYFGDKVDLYLDGGVRSRKPSTVIKIINEEVELIRIGAEVEKIFSHLNNLGFKLVGKYEI